MFNSFNDRLASRQPMFNSFNDRLASRPPMFNSALTPQGGCNNGSSFPLVPVFQPQLPDWARDDPQLKQVLRDMGCIPSVTGPPGATNNANASGTAGGESYTGRAGLAGVALDEEIYQSSTESRVGGVTSSSREFYSRRSAAAFVTRPSPATANGKQGATSPKGDEEQGVPTDGDEQRAPTEQEMKEQELAAKLVKTMSQLQRILNFMEKILERKMHKKMRADKF